MREILPPLVFPPYEDTSEDEEEMEYPHDQEMLGERKSILDVKEDSPGHRVTRRLLIGLAGLL